MILLTAATPWEARPVARALSLKGGPLYLGKTGLGTALLETGIGPESARAALESLPGGFPPGGAALKLVISAGLAGALQPGLSPGDLIVDAGTGADAVANAARRSANGSRTIHISSGAPGPRPDLGRIVSADRVIESPAGKRALGKRTGAGAVDMESGAVREWAKTRGVPFAAVRVILDSVDESLPEGLPESAGLADAARFALRSWRKTPQLARLWKLQRTAMKSLCPFLGTLVAEIRKGDEP